MFYGETVWRAPCLSLNLSVVQGIPEIRPKRSPDQSRPKKSRNKKLGIAMCHKYNRPSYKVSSYPEKVCRQSEVKERNKFRRPDPSLLSSTV